MRLVVGSALVVRAGFRLWSDLPPMNVTIPAVLLTGSRNTADRRAMDTHRGNFVALIEIWNILTLPGDKWVWLLLGTAGAALAMLGPGLWSVDAHLFGWRRVETPSRKASSNSL